MPSQGVQPHDSWKVSRCTRRRALTRTSLSLLTSFLRGLYHRTVPLLLRLPFTLSCTDKKTTEAPSRAPRFDHLLPPPSTSSLRATREARLEEADARRHKKATTSYLVDEITDDGSFARDVTPAAELLESRAEDVRLIEAADPVAIHKDLDSILDDVWGHFFQQIQPPLLSTTETHATPSTEGYKMRSGNPSTVG